MFKKQPLTIKVFVYTILVSIGIWIISDKIQTIALTDMFYAKLEKRFSLQAEKQRILFDRYGKGLNHTVNLFSKTHSITEYVSNTDWLKTQKPVVHTSPPPWLPDLSIIRNFIQPRYLFLLDKNDSVKEIYQARDKAPPENLLKPSKLLLSLSHDQGFLTQLSNQIYLVSNKKILNNKNRIAGTLMLAAPLDEEFLIASQGAELDGSNIIALTAENRSKILVSSNTTLIPGGTDINSLKDRYLITGQGFFDYGATDIIIELISFISTKEVNQLTNEVANEARLMRLLAAIAFIAAFLVIIYFVTRRLQLLTKKVVEFSKTLQIEEIDNPDNGDELHILEENFQNLANAVERETTALEHQALHDPLTELPNRKLLNNRLQQEILRSERRNIPLVLIMSDLNRFKEINDTLGHHIGDLVLQQAARRLFRVFRKTDSVARLGGDEFSVLLPETNIEQAIQLARKVLEEFEKPFIVEDNTLSVGISIGLAECPIHGNDVNILVQRADVAMYLAKRENLGYAVYDPNKDTHSIGRLALMTDFREAIDKDLLELYYQPKINIRDNTVLGVEALLRWNHPERGLIMPEEFIPLAEQTGLIKPLANFVLKQSIQQCLELKRYVQDLNISLNISVHSLHDTAFIKYVESQSEFYQLSLDCLTLEITESDIMVDPIRALETLEKLNEMGIKVSIDDFGTGYSSLSYLKQLPVHELKIDRSFIAEMVEDEDDAVIVKATIDMAHNLGLKVVAEGVENQKTLDYLKSMNCDIAQGFYYSNPIPATELVDWLIIKEISNPSAG